MAFAILFSAGFIAGSLWAVFAYIVLPRVSKNKQFLIEKAEAKKALFSTASSLHLHALLLFSALLFVLLVATAAYLFYVNQFQLVRGVIVFLIVALVVYSDYSLICCFPKPNRSRAKFEEIENF